jgi:ligand-binding sensor domain-containing protein/signal transduction histidine kinase
LRNLNTFREDGPGRRRLVRCALAGLGVLWFAVSASAVDPTRTVSQYLHDSWGTERGWPGGSITAIAQTSDGYLWIGTDKGLLRFDGFSFYQFERAHPDAMVIGPVRTLLVDASDNLWILLQNTIVFRYHDGNFELVRGWSENGTTAMARETSGAVLLSSLAEGTVKYSDNRFRTLSSAALLADAARVAYSAAPDQRAIPFSWFDRLAVPTSLVISIVQTDDGKIWLGTEGRGLFYLQEGRVSSASKGRVDTRINCLLPLQNSELWVGTAKGALRWNGKELTSTGVPLALRNLGVLSILRDRDSNVWVGTSRGLFRYNASGVSLLSSHETTGPVAALFEDREGNIWMGSARGLEQLRDSAFVTYSLPNLKSQSMGPLHVDAGDRTWIAPIEGGLRWLKEDKSEVVTAGGIANDVVYSITSTGKDDVWVGRQQGGLTHLRYSGNSFTAKTYTESDGLAQNRVYAVYRSRDGTVWSGTLNRGVSQLKNGHFTNYTTADGLAANTISSIAEGADGTMWFGTPSGLSALTQNGWQTSRVSEGLPSQDVNCLLQDSNGVLWIGTAEGLAFFSAGHLKVPQVVPDSLHEPIFGLAEDKNGGLWVATAGHVLQVKQASLLGSALSKTDIREYGLSDGLLSTEGVKRSQSMVVDSQGRVWFSTNRGLSVVNASRATANSVPALVHIEAVSVDGNPVDPRGPIRFPAGDHRMTFRYVGLSLGNSDRVRYRYMLENFDHGWSQPVTNRETTYGSLGPGTYRFRVMASNNSGVWNETGTYFDFAIAPAYHQTTWFRVTGIIVFLSLLGGIYRLRLKQVARQVRGRMEERLEERERIARDLHDTLLQSVQGLILKFHAVAKQIPSDEPAHDALEKTLDHADEVLAEGRDRLRNLRAIAIPFGGLPAAFERVAEETPQGADATFKTVVEGRVRELHPMVREECYWIGREAVVNALTHSNGRKVEVEITYDPRQFRLRVRDDGQGIDPEILEEGGRSDHWGLQGMRERAQKIGGQLKLWSRPETGTEVELIIPGASAYQTAHDKSKKFWRRSASDNNDAAPRK